MPAPSYPLGVNPYIYCENNPVMLTDSSGLKGKFVRGATMGGAQMWLGTIRPGKLYDCCEEGFTAIPDDKVWNAKLFWHTLIGFFTYRQAAKLMKWKDLCDLDPSKAQPGHGCSEITTMDPDLACTFLQQCKGGSCPPDPVTPPPPPKKQKKENKDPGCPEGITYVDITDPSGVTVPITAESFNELMLIMSSYNSFVDDLLADRNTGILSNLRSGSSWLWQLNLKSIRIAWNTPKTPFYLYSWLSGVMNATGECSFPEDEVGCARSQEETSAYLTNTINSNDLSHWSVINENAIGHNWVYLQNNDDPEICLKFDLWQNQNSDVYIVTEPIQDLIYWFWWTGAASGASPYYRW
jgi:hypothetical protein